MGLLPLAGLTCLSLVVGQTGAQRIAVLPPHLDDTAQRQINVDERDELSNAIETAVKDTGGVCVVSQRQLEIAEIMADRPQDATLCGLPPSQAMVVERLVSVSLTAATGIWSVQATLTTMPGSELLSRTVQPADSFQALLADIPTLIHTLITTTRGDSTFTGRILALAKDSDPQCTATGVEIYDIEATETWVASSSGGERYHAFDRLQREAARAASRKSLQAITIKLDEPYKSLAKDVSTPFGAWIDAALVGHAERFVRLIRNLDEQLDAAKGKAKLKARVCFDAGALELRIEQRLAFLNPPARPKLVILGTDEAITGLLERSLKALGYESTASEVLKGRPGKRGPSGRHKKRARKLLKKSGAQTAIIAIVRDTGTGLDGSLQQSLEIRLTALGAKGKPIALSTVHVMAFASSADEALARLESTWIKETPIEIERFVASIAEAAKPN